MLLAPCSALISFTISGAPAKLLSVLMFGPSLAGVLAAVIFLVVYSLTVVAGAPAVVISLLVLVL